MEKFLKGLKQENFVPKKILDIGAEKGKWTDMSMKIFDDCSYPLIEPIKYVELERFNKNSDKFSVFNIILNDYDGQVNWYEMRNKGDSINKERTHHFSNCSPVIKECKKLDTIIKNETFDLIKIDVQGAELKVLEGAKELIKNTAFIIMEMPFMCQFNENTPSFLEHILKLDEIGFIVYDIIDQHRSDETLLFQIDVCFINKDNKLQKKLQNRIENMGK